MKRLILAAMIVVAMMVQAGASPPPGFSSLPLAVVTNSLGPIEITEYSSSKADNNSMILACVGFVNHDAKTATAIKLRYFLTDPFDDVQTTEDKTIDGRFSRDAVIKISLNVFGSPNDVDQRCMKAYLFVDKTRKLLVRIEKVLFADGSVWESPYNGSDRPYGRKP